MVTKILDIYSQALGACTRITIDAGGPLVGKKRGPVAEYLGISG